MERLALDATADERFDWQSAYPLNESYGAFNVYVDRKGDGGDDDLSVDNDDVRKALKLAAKALKQTTIRPTAISVKVTSKGTQIVMVGWDYGEVYG